MKFSLKISLLSFDFLRGRDKNKNPKNIGIRNSHRQQLKALSNGTPLKMRSQLDSIEKIYLVRPKTRERTYQNEIQLENQSFRL